MLLLTIEDLARSYGERVLFQHVTFHIETGDKIGILGVNGTGKSTLLRHVAELDGGRDGQTGEPGKITPNGACVIEYLPQYPPYDPQATVLEQIFRGNSPMMTLLRRYRQALDDTAAHPEDARVRRRLLEVQQEMDRNFAWQIESEARAVLTRLGIHDMDRRVGELSVGQRKRVALAGVLVRPSDLLLLDEPTNHMDSATVAWLEGELAKRKGALLLVTHDRYFLDRVTNRTLELDGGRAYLYKANYEGFLQLRAERRQQEAAAERKLQNIYRRELAWIRRGAEARRTKKKDRVERFRDIEAAAREKTGRRELDIEAAASRLGRTVLELDHVGARYDGHDYIKDFSYIVLRRDRVGILGPNGAGKTTLLNILAGRRDPDTGSVRRGQTVKIGYFSQTSEFPDPRERVLEYIRDAGEYVTTADGTRVSAAMMLERFLFPPELQWVPVGKLSGGEQRRLFLLRVLMEAPNVLLLDEPTNDLDIPTLSVLEEYLDTFPGAVLAVSHDRYFLDRFAEKIFAFGPDGTLRQYPGGYSDYEAARAAQSAGEEAGSPNRPSAKVPKSSGGKDGDGKGTAVLPGEAAAPADGTPVAAPRKITFSERIERDQLEQEIAALEATEKMLAAQIGQAGGDFAVLTRLTRELEAARQEEERKLERWTFLSELEASE